MAACPDPVPRSRILLVDDDADVRRALSKYISFEHAVVAVATADEALDRLRDSRFSLALLDIRFDDQIASGKAKLTGNRSVYEQLKTMLVHFELGFEMMPGTGKAKLSPKMKPFQQGPLGRSDGG